MANQDTPMENGEDFSQDVTADQNQENGQHNGGGDGQPSDSGAADKPGKDDDRYVGYIFLVLFTKSSYSPFYVPILCIH